MSESPSDPTAPGTMRQEPCTCRNLERWAKNPDVPIVFDERTCEYHFRYQVPDDEGPSILMIYHCPLCGGAAPRSQRAALFHTVPTAERERLFALLASISTLGEAIEQLGPPDEDSPHGSVRYYDEEDSRPPTAIPSRMIAYQRLSPVAVVRFYERQDDGKAWYAIEGKQRS